MPIRFYCSECHRQLSVASRKAGNVIACPVCNADLTIPFVDEIVTPGDIPVCEPSSDVIEVADLPRVLPVTPEATATVNAVPIVRPVAVPAPVPAPALVPTVAPASAPPQSVAAAVVAAVLILAILGGVVASILSTTAEFVSRDGVGPALADTNLPPLEVAFKKEGTPQATPETPSAPPLPALLPPIAPPLASAGAAPAPEQPREEAPKPSIPRDDSATVARELPQHEPQPAQPVKFFVKRHKSTTDEELRKQLFQMPELTADEGYKQKVITWASNGRAPGAIGSSSSTGTRPGSRPDAGAAYVIRQEQDLAYLPMRKGYDCMLSKEPAEEMHVLSRKLRTLLEAAIPKNNIDVRPDPERLRALLLGSGPGNPPAGQQEWLVPTAIPTLQQLLMAESQPVRMLLVDLLKQIQGKEASAALAQRAVFDVNAEVREAALLALKDRPREEYRNVLLEGLRYPWPAAADHAAEALVALQDKESVPRLVDFLKQPDPKFVGKEPPGGRLSGKEPEPQRIREVVRINHMANCILCHKPSFDTTDLVRGRVPIPGSPLPAPASTPAYYEGTTGTFVRADITYLKQDFSIFQPVVDPGPWPQHQRYDYVVITRPLTPKERSLGLRNRDSTPADQPLHYEQRDAVLFALRELTGKDGGPGLKDWEIFLKERE